jgi:hypothetical protein
VRGKRADTLLFLMERIETFTLQRVWDRLTDDELFWEPSPRAWGVRRRTECRTPNPFGDGEWVVDFDHDVAIAAGTGEAVEPMTTIGWLLWHIGSMPGRLTEIDLLGGSRTMASGWTSPYLTHHPVFTTAADAVGTLREGWEALRAVLESTDDDALERATPRYTYGQVPPSGGLEALGPPGPEHPAVFFVVSTLNEVGHHGTQICTLRDLYRSVDQRPS